MRISSMSQCSRNSRLLNNILCKTSLSQFSQNSRLLNSIIRKSSMSPFSPKPLLLSYNTRRLSTKNFVHVRQRVSQIRSKFHLPSMYRFSKTRNCSASVPKVFLYQNSYSSVQKYLTQGRKSRTPLRRVCHSLSNFSKFTIP